MNENGGVKMHQKSRSSKWHSGGSAGDETSRGQIAEGLECHEKMFGQEYGSVR